MPRQKETSVDAPTIDVESAFQELRPAMLALAYRITGSRSDAEDIVQDVFVRLKNAEPQEAIRSFKAYLTTITARLSLNRLRNERAQRESYVGEWLPEPVPTQDDPSAIAAEISFGLMVMLERLSPLERAVFVLRSALEFSFEEIATVVHRNSTTCRKLFERARKRVLEDRTRFRVDSKHHEALMRSFHEASRGGDFTKLLNLLREDVTLHGDGGGKALGLKNPVVGREAVARFVIALGARMPADTLAQNLELNGAPATLFSSRGHAFVVILVEVSGDQIQQVFAIANPDKLAGLAKFVAC